MVESGRIGSEIMENPQVREWLTMVQDENSACVDRGEAIVKLRGAGMLQKDIAASTHLSSAAISHLRKCFDLLRGKARQMCKDRKMNGDACYLLARHKDSNQEQILRRAIKVRERNDTRHPRGRRTPPGQITEEDIREAIKIEKENE